MKTKLVLVATMVVMFLGGLFIGVVVGQQSMSWKVGDTLNISVAPPAVFTTLPAGTSMPAAHPGFEYNEKLYLWPMQDNLRVGKLESSYHIYHKGVDVGISLYFK